MEAGDKRYQVFVSSTYEDLKEERQEIMHALLELDCIPSGMELFPAADEDQWTLIKGVIDDCDYYVVVIAGRYGSLGPDGVSYTEMEYRYALSAGKPVIAFLHKDPASLPAKYCEKTEEARNKLDGFREFVQQKMCKSWSTPQDLGSVVSRSLIMLQKKHPGIGWIRGDQVASQDATREILALRKKVDELESKMAESQIEAPRGTEQLSQGEDEFSVACTFDSTGADGQEFQWNWHVDTTWNELFSEMSPLMLHESNTVRLKARLSEFVTRRVADAFKKHPDAEGHRRIRSIKVDESDFETILIQLSALGLIVQSIRTRSVHDKGSYWTLTPYGVTLMNRLRAVKRDAG